MSYHLHLKVLIFANQNFKYMYAITGTKSLAQQPRIKALGVSRFFRWAEKQNDNRLTWLALALAGHGCFLTPLTVMLVMATTQNFTLFMAAIGAMTLALVTNLAALPTKITIPAFIISIVIDVVIMAVTLISIV
jgi:hypothetical protein